MIPVLGDILRYQNGVLYFKRTALHIYLGEGLNRTTDLNLMNDLVIAMGLYNLEDPRLGTYNVLYSGGNFTITDKDGNNPLNFISPSQPHIDIHDLQLASEEIIALEDIIYADIIKDRGFKVRTSETTHEQYYVKNHGIDDIFVTRGDDGSHSVRCYIHRNCNNTILDLSRESFTKYGINFPVLEKALVELTFDDRQVMYTDLVDGVDIFNGISVNNKVITSQRVITKFNIYYESPIDSNLI